MGYLKTTVATFATVAVLSVGTAFAGDGIIVGNRDGIIVGNKAEANTKCSATTNTGIIVGNVVGILVSGLTGIIVGNRDEGIIVGNRAACDQQRGGLLISD